MQKTFIVAISLSFALSSPARAQLDDQNTTSDAAPTSNEYQECRREMTDYVRKVQAHNQNMTNEADLLAAQANGLRGKTDRASRQRLTSIQNWLSNFENMKNLESRNIDLISRRLQSLKASCDLAKYNAEREQEAMSQQQTNMAQENSEKAFEDKLNTIQRQRDEELAEAYKQQYCQSGNVSVSDVGVGGCDACSFGSW